MKNKFVFLFLGMMSLHTGAMALTEGDLVNLEALKQGQIIQGDLPKDWEPGKLYFIECWATWCSPCVAAIPEIDAKYDKFMDKGLRVIGVNVKEGNSEKVAAFVRKQADGMSYPVIFTGNEGSLFDRDWLKASGVAGLPETFVVMNGKFLFRIHPAQITDHMIEALLAGGKKGDAFIEYYAGARQREEKASKAAMELHDADVKGDYDLMIAKFIELNKLGTYIPNSSPGAALVRKKDWVELEKFIPKFACSDSLVIDGANVLVEEGEAAPKSVYKAMLTQLKNLKNKDKYPVYKELHDQCEKRAGE